MRVVLRVLRVLAIAGFEVRPTHWQNHCITRTVASTSDHFYAAQTVYGAGLVVAVALYFLLRKTLPFYP